MLMHSASSSRFMEICLEVFVMPPGKVRPSPCLMMVSRCFVPVDIQDRGSEAYELTDDRNHVSVGTVHGRMGYLPGHDAVEPFGYSVDAHPERRFGIHSHGIHRRESGYRHDRNEYQHRESESDGGVLSSFPMGDGKQGHRDRYQKIDHRRGTVDGHTDSAVFGIQVQTRGGDRLFGSVDERHRDLHPVHEHARSDDDCADDP